MSTAAAADYFRLNVFYLAHVRTVALYDAFGVIGTALQEKIGIFYANSLKMDLISPNTSYATRGRWSAAAEARPRRAQDIILHRVILCPYYCMEVVWGVLLY